MLTELEQIKYATLLTKEFERLGIHPEPGYLTGMMVRSREIGSDFPILWIYDDFTGGYYHAKEVYEMTANLEKTDWWKYWPRLAEFEVKNP